MSIRADGGAVSDFFQPYVHVGHRLVDVAISVRTVRYPKPTILSSQRSVELTYMRSSRVAMYFDHFILF